MFVPVIQLAQAQTAATPSQTSTLYEAIRQTAITRLLICNTTAAAQIASLYHDDDGSTYGAGTALYNQTIGGNATLELISELTGAIGMRPGGHIGIAGDATSCFTFTAYGIITDVARAIAD